MKGTFSPRTSNVNYGMPCNIKMLILLKTVVCFQEYGVDGYGGTAGRRYDQSSMDRSRASDVMTNGSRYVSASVLGILSDSWLP